MPSHNSSSKSVPNTDPSRFPLIRDILKSYPISNSDSSADNDPSDWLSEPAVVEAFRKHMPIGYTNQDKILLDASGQLLVWGAVKANWNRCLCIEGLKWVTVRTDLLDLLSGREIIDPPIILGTATNFTVLVYMRNLEGCEDVIVDLNGAEISRETTLRVAFATKADLRKALSIQEQTLNKS